MESKKPMQDESEFNLPLGTLALVDTQAMFFSSRATFGPTNRTDYLRLKLLIEREVQKANPYNPNNFLDLKAYVITYGNYDTTKFRQLLKGFGYSVEEKIVAKQAGSRRLVAEGSWNDEMIAEAVQKNQRYQRVIFVTGDGTLVRLVELLKGTDTGRLAPHDKIEVWVVFFEKNLNAALAKVAHRTIILDRDVIWTIEEEEQRRWDASKR